MRTVLLTTKQGVQDRMDTEHRSLVGVSMKSLVVGFSVFVLWTLLTYAVGAFVPLEPNPLLWTEDGRAGFAIFGVVLGLWFGVISGVLSRAGGS